ncbi:MAG: hypothetical protein KKE55_03585 [Candidatus Omnitrophica bacterium]|nr:hypothetical protein [Candidatus Omnitrophota bacterium]MBU1523128.1 hypothetical protein [Candidatus Omnitrophota bacterium]MBU2436759.1 hypothetical protein [Candidatus Omnitrophota bacterium]
MSRRKIKAQATAEMAILGSLVLLLLGYLVSQGFLYNQRQALEMYTFRKAMEVSKSKGRGVSLTVMRDVFSPSFSPSLGRSKTMASASVDANWWKIFIPDVKEDVTDYQLVQIGDAMITQGKFLQIPPMKMKVKTQEHVKEGENPEWQWTSAVVRELDSQIAPSSKTFNYDHLTHIQDTSAGKTVYKKLSSTDTIPIPVTFESGGRIRQDYFDDDSYHGTGNDKEIVSVELGNIPANATLTLTETAIKERSVNPR